MKRTFILLALLASISVPSCRTRAKVEEPTIEPPGEAPAGGEAAARPLSVGGEATSGVVVEAPWREFSEPAAAGGPSIAEEDLATINQRARSEGWIADAFFDLDRAALTDAAQEALTHSAGWLRTHPGYALTIEGHCDDRGTEQYNLALGDRRAQIARTYLGSLGVDASRLETVSYGEEKPFAVGESESAWSQNRRAHLVLKRAH
jgi:peptidoglycan-associated lipoprotein